MIDHWKCAICNKMRPDSAISVRTHALMVDGMEFGSENVKFCNDNPKCIEQSKTFTYIKNKE